MAAWLAAEGYCGRTPAAVFLDRLRTAPAGLTGVEAAARRHVTLALLARIDAIEDQAAGLGRRIREALVLVRQPVRPGPGGERRPEEQDEQEGGVGHEGRRRGLGPMVAAASANPTSPEATPV